MRFDKMVTCKMFGCTSATNANKLLWSPAVVPNLLSWNIQPNSCFSLLLEHLDILTNVYMSIWDFWWQCLNTIPSCDKRILFKKRKLSHTGQHKTDRSHSDMSVWGLTQNAFNSIMLDELDVAQSDISCCGLHEWVTFILLLNHNFIRKPKACHTDTKKSVRFRTTHRNESPLTNKSK